MHTALDAFHLIISIAINASRSMILQAEGKREYEEVSVKEADETALMFLVVFHLPLKEICWSENVMVFILGLWLGHI